MVGMTAVSAADMAVVFTGMVMVTEGIEEDLDTEVLNMEDSGMEDMDTEDMDKED